MLAGSRDLRTTLLLAYGLLIGWMLTLGLLFNLWSTDRLLRDVETSNRALAQAIGLETEAWLQDAMRAVEALAQTEAVRRHDLQALPAIFGPAFSARPDAVLIYLLDRQGIMRYHYPEGPGSTVGWDFSFRDYFQAAMRAQGPVISKGRISPTTGKPVVTVAMPLRDAEGAFNGLVAINLSLERLSAVLRTVAEASSDEKSMDLRLYDAAGQLIASSGSLLPLDPAYALDSQKATPSGLVHDPGGRAWLATSLPLPRSGWRILVRRPADEALATLHTFQRGMLLLLLLVLASGFAFWHIMTRQVLQPLEAIAHFSREIGEHPGSANPAGILDLTNRKDQIGHLARSLLWMQGAIEQRLNELRTLLDTGRIVLASLETEKVIATILEQVQRLLKVHTCALFTLDERTGRYHVRAVRGLSPDYARGLFFHPDDPRSPTMRAIRTGRPAQIADVEVEGYPELQERARREGFRSLLAVPLMAHHISPAALVIYRPDPHRFTEEEISLAWNFANLAAFALEHALLYARSDALLQQQTRRLETLIEHLHEGLILESREGEILYMNRRAAWWCGLEEPCPPGCAARLAYKPLLQRFSASGDVARLLQEAMEGTVEGLWRVGDLTRDLRIQSILIPGMGGEPIGRILVFQDITSERELDRAKSALLSAVSHELRTPLAAIKGYTTTLLAEDVDWDPAARREFLQIILEETERLTRLVNNLLDLSRLEAGALVLQRQPYPLEAILARVQRDLRVDSHPISIQLPPDLPPVDVDPARIEVVFRNLLDNAIRYTPPGTPITISATIADGVVVVRVHDEGPGIPPEHRERIFDRFYRIPGHIRSSGAGLGLAICKGFVEAHGGRIWLAEDGPGATFIFTLPTWKDEDGGADFDRG